MYSHRGQPAYSPGRLALVTAMQFMENYSDRQAAEAVRARIDWKYALALPLGNAGFDSSVLCEFRQRLLRGGAEERLLGGIIERLSAAGLIKKRGRQRTDSTRVLASVRELGRLELVGVWRCARRSTSSPKRHRPSCAACSRPEWPGRYGRRIEETRLPEGKKARAVYAGRVGRDGFELLDALEEGPERPARLRRLEAVRVLRRIWNEQYDRPEERGALPALRERRGRAPAGRAESPYDPEARYRSRSGKRWTGYAVHLSETCDSGQPRLVTHVDTTTADVHEANRTAGIHKALSRKGLAPRVHLADSAYIDAGHLAEAEDKYGIQLVGPTRKDPSWQAQINAREGGRAIACTKDQFEIDWAGRAATCPEGKRSGSWSELASEARGDYIRVRFRREDCQNCRIQLLCTKAEQRSLTLHPEREHRALEEARALMQTYRGKQLYAKRAGVEAAMSQAVRRCGLRRTRYRGLAKTHLGHLATAAALNLERAAAWMSGKRPAGTRVSRFARLAKAPAAAAAAT